MEIEKLQQANKIFDKLRLHEVRTETAIDMLKSIVQSYPEYTSQIEKCIKEVQEKALETTSELENKIKAI